ncbi:MAG TPA: hypothetical protein VK783_06440, partial [Bacteroidia bacterium]|nr:hypothetical protein [Bacteroidia bacterium]
FQELFVKIIEQEDMAVSVPQYNSLREFFRTKRFSSSESFINSLKCENLKRLLFDMNHQVRQNLTTHFKGYFHNSDTTKLLPCIEYYEVNNIQDFHKDTDLKSNFKTGLHGYYALPDNELEVYFDSRSRNEQRLVQVVKQKGHGKKHVQENDVTDYDWLESHYLLESLAFPCVFNYILQEQSEKLNRLKRRIYDFVNYTNKMNILKSFLFVFRNKKYIELKQTLTQILLTNKRFESEFTKQNISSYTREFQLQDLKPRNSRIPNDTTNLFQWIIENFSVRIENLDKKTKDTNEIFETIEELNSYITNLFLQVISLFIASLAFIFTFNKTKNYINYIYHLILNHFNK